MSRRAAFTPVAWLTFLASVAIFAVLVGLLWWRPQTTSQAQATESLTVYCAAGLKAPVEKIARDYEQQYGVCIQLEYGGSQTLLARLAVADSGDLYLPGDERYLDHARARGLLAESLPVARMAPVLVVPRGTPRQMHNLSDILRGDVRLAQANPEAAAVGKLAQEAIEKHGHWAAFQKHIVVSKPTVNDVAGDVRLGSVDAGIVWDATVRQHPDLEMVRLPELEGSAARIAVGVLERSTQPTAALRFARFLAACDRGLPIFEQEGYTPADGDPWAETPQLRLFAGAMLRPAIQHTLQAFEQREGVRIETVFNGCGILVAQMHTQAGPPDAYFACDKSFLTQVHDLFLDPVTVSENQLVIFVKRGNPHHVESLDDLGQPGLRVGVGHEKQCAMGALTQETLKQGGVRGRVMPNVKVQSPTGDMLVNQMLAGSLDAVIAYVSNGAEQSDKLEAIPIDIPCALAVQPIAIARDCRHKQLAGRLVDAIRSQQSRERFESYGFRWRAARQP